MEAEKTCKKCSETKPIAQFHRNPKTKDGYYGICKSCCAIYQQDYRRKNKDNIKQDKKNYASKNDVAIDYRPEHIIQLIEKGGVL